MTSLFNAISPRSSLLSITFPFLITWFSPPLVLATERTDDVVETPPAPAVPEPPPPSPPHQTFSDKLDLTMGLGYGNISDRFDSSLLDPNLGTVIFYDRLGMQYSETASELSILANYAFTRRIGAYISVSGGAVMVSEERELDVEGGMWGNTKVTVTLPKATGGLGDPYIGAYINLLPETKFSPSITFDTSLNSCVAKYSSLGDGLWDIAPSLKISKSPLKWLHFLALGEYTYKLERAGVKSGDAYGFGGRIGLGNPDVFTVLAGATSYSIGEIEVDGEVWADPSEDLVLFLSLLRAKKSMGSTALHVTMGNVDEGFSFERNYLGVMLSMTN